MSKSKTKNNKTTKSKKAKPAGTINVITFCRHNNCIGLENALLKRNNNKYYATVANWTKLRNKIK